MTVLVAALIWCHGIVFFKHLAWSEIAFGAMGNGGNGGMVVVMECRSHRPYEPCLACRGILLSLKSYLIHYSKKPSKAFRHKISLGAAFIRHNITLQYIRYPWICVSAGSARRYSCG